MIPYLLITKNEFIKLITFKYSWKRYLFAFSWYSMIGSGIYFHNLILPNVSFVNYYDINIFVFIVLFLLITRGIFITLPNIKDKKINEEFRNQIAVIIACHNSEDVLPYTLGAAIKHFPPEAIYIADNNKVIPTENKTEELCKDFGVNYIFTQVSNKTLALRNTVNYIDKKYKYLISMDDDTLFPNTFYLDKDTFSE